MSNNKTTKYLKLIVLFGIILGAGLYIQYLLLKNSIKNKNLSQFYSLTIRFSPNFYVINASAPDIHNYDFGIGEFALFAFGMNKDDYTKIEEYLNTHEYLNCSDSELIKSIFGKNEFELEFTYKYLTNIDNGNFTLNSTITYVSNNIFNPSIYISLTKFETYGFQFSFENAEEFFKIVFGHQADSLYKENLTEMINSFGNIIEIQYIYFDDVLSEDNSYMIVNLNGITKNMTVQEVGF